MGKGLKCLQTSSMGVFVCSLKFCSYYERMAAEKAENSGSEDPFRKLIVTQTQAK